MTRNFLALRRRPERTRRRLALEPLESRQLLAGDTVNHPPVAVNDTLATMQGTPLAIASADLLANDSDPDGDSLRVTVVAGGGPTHGTLSLTSAGNFYYLPQHDFVGSDSFLYFAWDGQAFSAQTTVTINVTPIVHPPEARNDYYATPVNTKLDVAAPGVLTNDGPFYPPLMQPMNDANQPTNPLPTPALTAVLDAGPAHGTVTLKGDGSFTYTPNQDFSGPDTFTYHDTYLPVPVAGSTTTPTPTSTNIATVTIAVTPTNPGPEARNDYYTTPENADLHVVAPGVLGNDSSRSNLPLTAVLMTGPSHGTLTLNADGSFAYSPAHNFFGLDQFVYRASDTPPGSLDPTSDTSSPIFRGSVATVSISVTPTNPPPVAQNDTYTATQGVPLTVIAPGVLGNDSGPAGDTLNAMLLMNPQHGTLTLNADGSFTYTPRDDFHGLDTFTYRAIDITAGTGTTVTASDTNTGGDSNGGVLPTRHDVATVSIYVEPIHTIAHDDTYSVLQAATLTVTAPGVLGNDTAPTGTHLAASLVTNAAHGTLTLNADGSFTYAPNADFSGVDTFVYKATAVASSATNTDASGQATVYIFVKPLNPPSEAHNDTYSTLQGKELDVAAPGVLANDSTTTNAHLTAVMLTSTMHGTLTLKADGSFSYMPNGDFTGIDTFTYRAVAATPTAGGTTPGSTLTTSDNTLPPISLPHDVATVTIFVKPLNPPPEAHNDTYSTQVNTELKVAAPGVLANDLAPDGHTLTAMLLPINYGSAAVVGPTHGTVVLNPDGSFDYTPATDYTGPDGFFYRAVDSTTTGSTTAIVESGDINSPHSDIAFVSIYVMPVRTTVEAHNDYYPLAKNTVLTVAAPGVLANDLGPSGSTLTTTLVTAPAHGSVVLNVDGSFTYTPETDFLGSVTFTYRASAAAATPGATNSDGTTAPHDVATVTIYVGVNSTLPRFILGSNQHATDEGGSQSVSGYATVVASDGSAACFNVTTDNPHLFSTPPAIDAAGNLNYTPAPNVSGTATVTVSINDGGATSGDSESFTIDVTKPHLLYNAANPCDVNGDSIVAPNDALMVINDVNATSGQTAGEQSQLAAGSAGFAYFDVNKDGFISPVDALIVINQVNAAQQAGGESASPAATDAALLSLMAQDTAEATMGRKRT